jgi:hypothetical protein
MDATEARNMTTEVGLWQIHYRPEQRAHLDPAFLPLDNSSFTDETLEFAVFKRLAASRVVDHFAYWGAVSWRFKQKTGLSGAELLAAVRAHPAADVFYMNPFPYVEALYQSPWEHGTSAHPDFMAVAEAVFEASDLPASELLRVTPSAEYAFCNYFIGRPAFWAAYLPFVDRILAAADANLSPKLRAKLHSPNADARGIHRGATYVPFIVERLITVFLRTAGKHLVAHRIPCQAGKLKLDPILQELRETKDVAILTGSARLLNRWQRQRREYIGSIGASPTENA